MSHLDEIAAKYNFKNIGSEDDPIFEPMSISFINTAQITQVGDYFKKHGDYEYPVPKTDEERNEWVHKFQNKLLPYDERAFWVREDERKRNGLWVPAGLENGKVKEIYIPGRYYFRLNYSRMSMVDTAVADTIGMDAGGITFGKSRPKTGKRELTFPKFWDWQYFLTCLDCLARELGLNFPWAKARRVGASYMGAVDNMYDILEHPMAKVIIAVFDKDYYSNDKKNGTLDRTKEVRDFLNMYTIWWRQSVVDTVDGFTFGRKVKGSSAGIVGFQSGVEGVSFKANPNAGVGGDTFTILVEEAGTFPNELLEAVIGMMKQTLEAGSIKTGMLKVQGTAGAEVAANRYYRSIIKNPRIINGIVTKDLFGKNYQAEGRAFFYPRHKTLQPFIDEHGNSLTEQALQYELEFRAREKAKMTPKAYALHCSQYALSPEDAFEYGSLNSILPTDAINAHIARLEVQQKENGSFEKHGIFVWSDKKAMFLENSKLAGKDKRTPIDPNNLTQVIDWRGCTTIIEEPVIINNGIPGDLYSMVVDPVGISKIDAKLTSKDSLNCVYVFKNSNTITHDKYESLVAVMIGRTEDPTEFDKQILLLGKYYNINRRFLYENNRGNIYGHYLLWDKEYDCMKQLIPSPRNDDSMNVFAETQKYGVSMTYKLKIKSLEQYAKYLTTVQYINTVGEPVMNLHRITHLPTLHALKNWDGDLNKNCDPLSSLLIYNILSKQLEREAIVTSKADTSQDYLDIMSPFTSDPFSFIRQRSTFDEVMEALYN